MPNSILPTQIGYTPPNSQQGSTVVLGRDMGNGVQFEAIGIGATARPDVLEAIIINLTNASDNKKIASIIFDVNDIIALMTANTNISTPLSFKLTEVAVCDSEQGEMNMVILASTPYKKAS